MSGDGTIKSIREETPFGQTTGRDMYWSELDADKKLERMRDIVRRHADMIHSLEKSVRELTHKVQNHQHLSDGKAAMSIFRDNQGFDFYPEKTRAIDPNKAYF